MRRERRADRLRHRRRRRRHHRLRHPQAADLRADRGLPAPRQTVVVGGPFATLCPEELRGQCRRALRGRGGVHLAAVRPRLRGRAAGSRSTGRRRSPTCPTRPGRASTCSSATGTAASRPVRTRLPVHLRVLRHHRHVRAQAALQAGRAGHRGGGGDPRARRGEHLLRRRQLRRQPRTPRSCCARWRSGRRPAASDRS